jgi:hypothetical protein
MQITLNDAQMASPGRVYGGPYFKEQSYQGFAARSSHQNHFFYLSIMAKLKPAIVDHTGRIDPPLPVPLLQQAGGQPPSNAGQGLKGDNTPALRAPPPNGGFS